MRDGPENRGTKNLRPIQAVRTGPRRDRLFVEERSIILRVFPEYFKRQIVKYIVSASQNIADSLERQLVFVQTAMFLVSENVNKRAQKNS